MSNIQINFQKSHELYLNKKPYLPYKIGWKLDLIVLLINGNFIQKQQLNLQQQMQYEDLQNLDQKGLKILFTNIIHTLFSQQNSKPRKCTIKKKGLFNNWANATISFDNSKLILKYSNKNKIYQMQQCEIKKSKQSSRQFQLICSKYIKYILKFQNQKLMKINLKEFQKNLIQSKSAKNYLQMTQIAEDNENNSFMTQIQIFSEFKNSNVKSNQQIKSLTFNKKNLKSEFQQVSKSPPSKNIIKKQLFDKKYELKPVPHGYITKYETTNLIIAMRKNHQSKIYLQYFLPFQISVRNLLSLLFIQKSWNNYIVTELIKRSKQLPNQILVSRKLDSFQVCGQFIDLYQKFTYTAFNEKSYMISGQSIFDSNNKINAKTLITIQHKNNFVKILIEDELSSNTIKPQILKVIVYDLYKQIIKLQFLKDKINIRNFQAQTLIESIVIEQQQSTGTSSQKQDYIQEYQLSYGSSYSSDKVKQSLQSSFQQRKNIPQLSKKPSNLSVRNFIHLQSPFQIPNLQFINGIKNKFNEKQYFKSRFNQQILSKYDDYEPHYSLQNMVKNNIYQILKETKQLKFIDQDLINSQKDVLKFVIRQVGANLISGKSVLNISLPVDIFQSRSALQRAAGSYSCALDYFENSGSITPEQQIKKVSAFIITQTKCQLLMKKPFNPILGETFQGYIKGIPIYQQQISHHPPASAFYLTCQDYTYWGNLVPFADMGLNSVVGGNISSFNIQFKNGSKFECYFAPSQISGLIYGDRKFRLYNKGFIWQRNNNLFAQISVQNQKKGIYQTNDKLKIGQLIGGIFRVKSQFFDQIDKFKKNYKNFKKFPGISKQYIIQKLNQVKGEWFGDLFIDDEHMNKNVKFYPVQYAQNLLPSDSNYRLDVLYHRMNDIKNSQKQKQNLQVLQRHDKKLREKYAQKK